MTCHIQVFGKHSPKHIVVVLLQINTGLRCQHQRNKAIFIGFLTQQTSVYFVSNLRYLEFLAEIQTSQISMGCGALTIAPLCYACALFNGFINLLI